MTQIKLGEQTVDLCGELPAVGSQAPDFLLTDNDLTNMTLKDFEGKRLVLNIFPSLNTPVCSASAHKFNEIASEMDNTTVLCISKDLAFNGNIGQSEGYSYASTPWIKSQFVDANKTL